MSLSSPIIIKHKCEECKKERFFRLCVGSIGNLPQKPYFYMCTKCGFWQDRRSFLSNINSKK